MPHRLTILLVDDNPDDRELARHALRKEFPDWRFQEISDAAMLDRALANGGFALVVTDYELQWTTGLEVLRAVKANAPDCPVVMFTASGDEEVAVEAMKGGLDDYIIKKAGHLPRLAAAARAAVTNARVRRRAEELERRLQDLLAHLEVGVFRVTPACELLEWNPALLRVLGVRTPEELEGSALLRRICHPGGRPDPADALRPHGYQTLRYEWITRPDGRTLRVRINSYVSRLSEGMVIDGLVEDMTGRGDGLAE